MKRKELEELNRMCGNLADLAAQEVHTQAEMSVSGEAELRNVWQNDRDVRVASNLVSHAAVMYNLLEELLGDESIIGKDAFQKIVNVLSLTGFNMNDMPEIDPGECDVCQKELSGDEMVALQCGCGASLREGA